MNKLPIIDNRSDKRPRGLRNNNPLNIVSSKSVWKGQIGVDHAGFCVFESMYYGIRAAYYLSLKYVLVHKVKNIGAFIRRWCPDDTAPAYISFVCDFLNRSRSYGLSFCSYSANTVLYPYYSCIDVFWVRFLNAMAIYENGRMAENVISLDDLCKIHFELVELPEFKRYY